MKTTEVRRGYYGPSPGHGGRTAEMLAYTYKLTGDIEYIKTGLRELAYAIECGDISVFTIPASKGSVLSRSICGTTYSVTYRRTADNRVVALTLQCLYPLLEVAHATGLLRKLEWFSD